MVYAIDTDAHESAALGALADAAERVGFPELSLALRAECLRRSEYGTGTDDADGSDE